MRFAVNLLRLYPDRHGDTIGDYFGTAVDGAGDVNGDQVPDIIVGANQPNGGPGYARIFSGADGVELCTIYGDSNTDYFGDAVSSAGDSNGDGYDEVIVGAVSERRACSVLGHWPEW